MARVTLDGVTFAYPGAHTPTLDNLSLVIDSGSAHALLGGSGAGKTTLLSLLSGLLEPTNGRVLFDDADMTRCPPGERNVAQVFQFPVLYDSMTVARNIEFPLKNRGVARADCERRAREIAEILDIADLLNQRPQALTLFQKQLVSIARALVRPDVALVLLDEPLTAVEPSIKWRLRRVLKTVQQELGATMLYVTHDQTEALTFAEAVSVMANGRILQSDTPRALYEAPSDEFVARFVGRAPMNLLDASVANRQVLLDGHPIGNSELEDGPVRVGFRAEWVQPAEADETSLSAQIVHQQVQGSTGGETKRLLTARLSGDDVQISHVGEVGAALNVRLSRYVLFREGLAVG